MFLILDKVALSSFALRQFFREINIPHYRDPNTWRNSVSEFYRFIEKIKSALIIWKGHVQHKEINLW